jgi:prenyltransferase beta subunit
MDATIDPSPRRNAVKKLFPFLCLLALPPTVAGQTADEKKATIAWLQALQTKEGGFRINAKADKGSLRGTSAALRALRYFGGSAKGPAACKTFVLSCLDKKSGGFADMPGGKPDTILTAVGLMALVELKVSTEPYEKKAIAFMEEHAEKFEEMRMAAAGLETIGKRCDKNKVWLKKLARLRNADGTFGKGKNKVRETGGAVAAVLRLGGKVNDPEAIVKALDAGQREDGGFGRGDSDVSDLETSYRVTRTYVMLKARPKRADDLRAFIAKCRNADGGYGVAPEAPSSVSGTYFASIILHWLSSKP